MSTTINVVGTVATDPKLVKSASGVQLSFRLASDQRRYDRESQSWVEGHTNWFGVVCFRGLAGHALESFSRGDRVIVSGRLRIRKWEKDDKSGTSVEIEAEAIGHDVRWGVSTFDKRVGAAASDHAGDRPSADGSGPSEETSPLGGGSGLGNGESRPFNGTNSQGEVSEDGFLPSVAAA